MYKYVHHDVPYPLTNIYERASGIHAHVTRQREHFRPVISRLNSSLHSLLYKGPVTWNLLPHVIKEASTLANFLRKLRYKLMYDPN